MNSKRATNIYQIYFSEHQIKNLDPSYIPLPNIGTYPEWYEYGPITKILSSQNCTDGFIGFFSHKFKEKSGLEGRRVVEFINNQPSDVDFISFSPFIDQSAFFENILDHGEFNHPGLRDLSIKVLKAVGLNTVLIENIFPHEFFIFSNFFVANARFWNIWSRIFDDIISIASDRTSPLFNALNAYTKYREGPPVRMIIFLLERLPGIILAAFPGIKYTNYPPFQLKTFGSKVASFPNELSIANALKYAYHHTRDHYYLQSYYNFKCSFLNSIQNRLND